jgi:hypothetical protein|nr:MAG TPA: hypothetical protein [Caudoviricetes sp.]
MTEQEQIEEMAKLIDGSECPSEKCPKMDKEQVKAFGACNIHRAQILYNAGYQKAEEVRKETAREIFEYIVKSGVINVAPDTIKMFFKEQYGVTAFIEEGEE